MQIEGIEPFNDFFTDCYFNALFPILIRKGISVRNFLLCRIRYPDVENNALVLRTKNVRDYDTMLQKMGIIFHSYFEEDIVSFIISSVQNEEPIIVDVDTYFCSWRKETYHKMHAGHSVLVYGYDGETANIIEHEYLHSIRYKKQTLSFEKLREAYFHDDYYRARNATAVEIRRTRFQEIPIEEFWNAFCSDEIQQSILKTMHFLSTMRNPRQEELEPFFYYVEYLYYLTYAFERYTENSKLSELLKRLHTSCFLVRGLCYKISCREIYNEEFFYNKLGQLIEQTIDLHLCLFRELANEIS